MKNILITFLLLPMILLAQKPIYKEIQKENAHLFKEIQLFGNTPLVGEVVNEILPDLQSGTLLSLEVNNILSILNQPIEGLRLILPFPNGSDREIILMPARSLSKNFNVKTSSRGKAGLEYDLGHHYWGIVAGQPQSAVSISVFEGQIMGMILVDSETYLLGPVENDDQQRHIFYKEKDLDATYHFSCGVDELQEGTPLAIDKSLLVPNPDNCVLLYVEADKDIFDDKGSVAAVTEYLTGLFNQVSLMYFNEEVKLKLNELFVWDTNDPYNSSSTSGLLSDFRNNIESDFTGDLAHLVGYDGGGGIAQLNVLCHPTRHHGYSGVNASYNNIPTYSWSVNVLTHELGHNIGSPHTHSCSWNGNNTPIDRCGIDEGYGTGNSCENDAPLPERGTIMSYCHLVGGVGMDFNLGFGPQPGDLIRDKVYNANCLTPCDPAPEICGDDFDNDFDGLTDCEDPDCFEYVECLPCEDNIVVLTIIVDNYPQETSWTLRDAEGNLVEESNNLGGLAPGTAVTEEFCLLDDCYEFTIFDTENDGICCFYGEGSYTLATADGQVLAEGGQFSNQQTVMLCEGSVPEACNDGIDNDGDGLIDCEDPDCGEEAVCQPCEGNTVVLQLNYDLYPLENSWAILDETGTIVIEGAPFETVEQSAYVEKSYCLDDGCYSFVIYDTESDGMCCQFGQGFYQLINTFGEVLATGGDFADEESTDFCIESAACPLGNVYTVTTTGNTGLGSLLQGIYCCNASENLDTIIFDLLPTDTLVFEEALPQINDNGIVIDGGENQVIQYTGTTPLFTINASAVNLKNLELLAPLNSTATGIQSSENNFNTVIENCKLENFTIGVNLRGRNNLIQNNTFFVPGFERGINILGTSVQTIIRDNVFFSEEDGYGVYLSGDTVEISNNEMYDLRAGIWSANSNKVDITENTFHHNRWGVYLLANTTYGQEHLISKNSFYCNRQDDGIRFLPTANGDHPSPEIIEISNTAVQGTALAGDEVEVFLNDGSACENSTCQGTIYLGTAFADPDGNWLLDNIELQLGDLITANATDENHNSSLFSECAEYTLACISTTFHMSVISEVICPGDSVLLYFESDVVLERLLEIEYKINNQIVTIDGYSSGDTIIVALPPFTTNIFELLSATDQFSCVFEVDGEEISIIHATDESLSSEYSTTLCLGDTLFLQNQVVTDGGEYIEIYQSFLSGCDSIVTINVELLTAAQTSEELQICEGDAIEIFGEMVSEAGIYQESYLGEFECDSIHTVHLEVLMNIETSETIQLCDGDTITLFGEEVTSAGIYSGVFDAANTCDSTHQITIELTETIHSFANESLCEGQTIIIFGEEVTEAGVYDATFMLESGCDSIHQITVEMVEAIHTFANESLCEGQTIIIFGEEVTEAGVYDATFMLESGCDSIHQITVETVEAIHTFANESLCEGQTIIVFGEEISEVGEYEATFTVQAGCDSIHHITVEMIDVVVSFANETICEGDTIEIFGEMVSEAGDYSDDFMAASGCDSIHTISLEVLSNIQTAETRDACLGQSIVVFGEAYTENAVVSEQFTSVDGCDSTHQVTIVFAEEILTEETMSICPGESVEIFGQMINEAGDFTDIFNSESGCDSIHTIHVVQLETVTTFEEVIICEGETVIVFEDSQTEAGVYIGQFVASNTCDSIHQIQLIVLENSESFTSLNICEGETIEIFGNLESETGTFSESFTAANGCDSIVNIELNVLENPVVEALVLPSCAGNASGSIELIEQSDENSPYTYQWMHTDENTAMLSSLEAGDYEFTVTDINNCSSSQLLTIEMSAAASYEISTGAESCFGAEDGSIMVNSDDSSLEISFEGGDYSTLAIFENLEAGDYSLAIRNAAGCQSSELVVLEAGAALTISNIETIEPSCNGEQNGSISLTLEGGTGNPVYQWGNGMTGSSIEGLEVGTYDVTIIDESGCEIFENIVLEGEASIESNLQISYGCGDGQITAVTQPSSGQSPYMIDWSTNQSGIAIGSLTAGFYSLSITDANGCTLDENFEIPFITPFEVDFSVQDVSCFDEQNGAIDLMVSGGIPPYEITWSNGETTEDLDSLGFGNYAYNVSAAGCSFASEILVNAPSDITSEVIFAPFGGDGLMGTAITQGGTLPYSYQWSNGQTTINVNALTQGQEIGLTITDANGCQYTEVYTAFITDVTNIDVAAYFNIFPNPTYDELIIEPTAGLNFDYNLSLYNTAGALLMKFEDQNGSRQVLSLQHLPTGVYLLLINTNKYSMVKRIVVLE